MKKIALLLLSGVMAISLTACSTKPAPATTAAPAGSPAATAAPTEIIVSAAASMVDVLNAVKTQFESENPTIRVKLNLGGSGALQQQIEQGAPVDLFISAATTQMDALVKKGLIDSTAVKTLATNKVVLIRGKSMPDILKSWDDLKQSAVKKIAIGNPDSVPVGQYSKAVLVKLGLWDAVQSRVVLAADVRQVLTYTESGQVEAGIVYSTDAASSQKVVVVAEAPAGSHAPVVYPMAVIKVSKHAAQAQAFADYLLSTKGSALLKQYGFGTAG